MTNTDDKQCILFFVKYPQVGQVKTRLGGQVGAAHAAELYKRFVLDMLSMLNGLETDIIIVVEPADACVAFSQWTGRQYRYVGQVGRDIGEKMKNALEAAFEQGYDRAVLIGSDLPELPGDFLGYALDALDRYDAVMGPAHDGGYYLIGFGRRSFLPEVFRGITWGGEEVFTQTMTVLDQGGLRTHVLPEWYDIDTAADLRNLVIRCEDTKGAAVQTMSYIAENKLVTLVDTK